MCKTSVLKLQYLFNNVEVFEPREKYIHINIIFHICHFHPIWWRMPVRVLSLFFFSVTWTFYTESEKISLFRYSQNIHKLAIWNEFSAWIFIILKTRLKLYEGLFLFLALFLSISLFNQTLFTCYFSKLPYSIPKTPAMPKQKKIDKMNIKYLLFEFCSHVYNNKTSRHKMDVWNVLCLCPEFLLLKPIRMVYIFLTEWLNDLAPEFNHSVLVRWLLLLPMLLPISLALNAFFRRFTVTRCVLRRRECDVIFSAQSS